MKFSKTRLEISKSLTQAINEISNTAKTKRGYGYSYAPLDQIIAQVKPILSKHKLTFMQAPETEDNKVVITTLVLHETGEWVKSRIASASIDMKGTNAVQDMGATITYLKRYALSSLLGIAAEEDTDAKGVRTQKAMPTRTPVKAPVKVTTPVEVIDRIKIDILKSVVKDKEIPAVKKVLKDNGYELVRDIKVGDYTKMLELFKKI